jgi:hypothetical protein
MAHQHVADPAPSYRVNPQITPSIEDRINELYANFEKLLEALKLEWCDECNAYVPSDPGDGTDQDPNPWLLDSLNEQGPNYSPPLPL